MLTKPVQLASPIKPGVMLTPIDTLPLINIKHGFLYLVVCVDSFDEGTREFRVLLDDGSLSITFVHKRSISSENYIWRTVDR